MENEQQKIQTDACSGDCTDSDRLKMGVKYLKPLHVLIRNMRTSPVE